MNTKEEQTKMSKKNMKLFPIYKGLAWDYLFYYTIDFLFYTQIKGLATANVILKESMYSVFCIIFQFPANFIL